LNVTSVVFGLNVITVTVTLRRRRIRRDHDPASGLTSSSGPRSRRTG